MDPPTRSIKCGARKASPRCYLCSGWSGAWLSSVCIWDPSIHCFYFVSSTATWFWNLLLDRISAKNQSFIKTAIQIWQWTPSASPVLLKTPAEQLMPEAACRCRLVREEWVSVNKHSASSRILSLLSTVALTSFSSLSVFLVYKEWTPHPHGCYITWQLMSILLSMNLTVPGGQISTQFQWETQDLPSNQCEQGCVERTHLVYLWTTGLVPKHWWVSLKSELRFGLVKNSTSTC